MTKIDIVDSHIHWIDPQRFSYPWLARRPDVDRRFLKDDYSAVIAPADVSRVVLVEAAASDDDAAGEADWMAEIGRDTALVGAIVAQAKLERGPDVREELARLADLPKVAGIRRVVRAPFQSDPDFCVRPDFIAGMRLLAECDLAFDVACGPGDLRNVTTLADACPDVRLVIDHMANPLSDGAGFSTWAAAMRELARRPNVSCKISGLQTHLPTGWDASAVRPYVTSMAEVFGPDRVLFGSDTPVQIAGGGFRPWLEALQKIFQTATESEQDLFFSGNARRIYRIR